MCIVQEDATCSIIISVEQKISSARAISKSNSGKICQLYNYECTMDQELAGNAAHAPANASCLLARRQHFSESTDVMAPILKV